MTATKTRPAPPVQPKPARPAGLPRDLEIRFDRAQRRIMAAKTVKERESAIAAKAAVLEEAARRADDSYLESARKELDRLESLRGNRVTVEEVVTVEPVKDHMGAEVWKGGRKVTRRVRSTRTRISNRDGLETLLTAHSLNAMQFSAGMRYRGLYEASDPMRGLTPPDPDRSGGGGGQKPLLVEGTTRLNDPGGITKILGAASAANALHDAEKAVARTCPKDAVQVLRAVAGAGTTIYQLAGQGSRRRSIRLTASLIDALDALADAWGLQ